MKDDHKPLETRVLVLAPTGRDAANSQAVLSKAGLFCVVCRDIQEACDLLEDGAGAVLLTEEGLSGEGVRCLAEALKKQPSWSDLPIAVLTRGGPDSPVALRAMESLGNVILLERPVRVSTLVIALRTALRMRARQYEERRHIAELKEADLRKDQFLAMLAHELRNPLAPIRNALQVFQLLLPADADVQHAREVVDRQVQHLTRLVDDLLDVSRITRGKVDLRNEPLDIATVVAQAVETSRPLLDERQQTLDVVQAGRPLMVDGDLTRLAEVVSNLLNNAAKYTQEGGHVWLTTEMEGDIAIIRVRDDGIGISAQMLPRVFDLFSQVDSSLDRSQGGLGIGLTLVRSLVQMHDGSVHVTSDGLGHGSEFTIRLPTIAGVSQPREIGKPKGPAASSSRRILIVDDNVDSAESLAALIGLWKHEVRTAYDGASALELAASFLPEIVVLDIGLPGIDGYELAGKLQSQPELGNPLLVALTGYGQEDDRDRAHAAGFSYHLTKPADLAALQELLATV